MTNAMATGFYLTPLCDRWKVMGVKVINVNKLFNNISVISWWSVLLVEEIVVPTENH